MILISLNKLFQVLRIKVDQNFQFYSANKLLVVTKKSCPGRCLVEFFVEAAIRCNFQDEKIGTFKFANLLNMYSDQKGLKVENEYLKVLPIHFPVIVMLLFQLLSCYCSIYYSSYCQLLFQLCSIPVIVMLSLNHYSFCETMSQVLLS